MLMGDRDVSIWDLSDDELTARLLVQQVPCDTVGWLVAHRDDPEVAQRIVELLC